MDSRERVMLALGFEEPDRVPVDFWGSRGFFELLGLERGVDRLEFLERADVDFRYIDGPRYTGPLLPGGQDIWGVGRIDVEVPLGAGREVYSEVSEPPLGSAKGVEEVVGYAHWPSPDWFDYRGIRDQCEAVIRAGRIAVFMGDRLNRIAQLKPAMYLRGVERILLDMAAEPAIARAIFEPIGAFYREYLTRILEAARGSMDIVLTGDDFGTQDGLLVSPSMWEEYLGPGFESFNRIIAEGEAISMHHTCGKVTPLVPFMADRGLRVLQSLQPEAMAGDFDRIKADYHGRLAFHGGISIQGTLPRGTPADVRDEVERVIAQLASGGGYVLGTAHNVQADCPMGNIDALLAAYREFSGYGSTHGQARGW